MAMFRLLHLSDTHLCIVPNRLNIKRLYDDPPALSLGHVRGDKLSFFSPSSYDPDVAEAAARFIYERRSSIDCVVCSGDLATSGRPDDLDVALDFYAADTTTYLYDRGPSIGFVSSRLVVVPGNHDRYQTLAGLPGSSNFDLKFPTLWNVRRPGVKRKIFEKHGDQLAVIAADFSLRSWYDAKPRSPYNWLGQGRVYRDALTALEARTLETRNAYPNAAVIWMVHFSATETCEPCLKLVDVELFKEALERHEIPIVLSGHLHQNLNFVISGGTQVLCAGACCSSEETINSWIHTVEISVDRGHVNAAERHNFRWNDNSDDFDLEGPILTFDRFPARSSQ